MARLQMRSKTDPRPRDFGSERRSTLSRVYFSAHPADHAKYLDALAKEIYRTHDCAFCFDARPDLPYDEDTLADLEHMNLFVIPITTRLLTDPVQRRVLEVDLPFAAAHHIPVLPLMQENYLDSPYEKVEQLKNRQFLNPHAQDMTALAYEDKLKTFLDGVLLSRSQVQEIRSAFAARIFLSYRKKDRALARELMGIIHEAPILRDVAIWYDEFLTPGEDFNESIRQELQDAHLFTLAVTPNLLEAGNYVIQYEYPAALSMEKPVLPVHVQDTAPDAFRRIFMETENPAEKEQIEKLVKEPLRAVEKEQLHFTIQQSLQTSRGVLLGENSDPMHLYRIGMAYLHGLDVEVDHVRAFELIHAAAQQNLPHAMTWLIHMYNTGLGVRPNAQEALRWNERLVQFWTEVWNYDPKPDFLRELIRTEQGLAIRLQDLGGKEHILREEQVYQSLFHHLQQLGGQAAEPVLYAQTYQNWGISLFQAGKTRHKEAVQYIEQGIELEKQSLRNSMDWEVLRNRVFQRYVRGGSACVKHGWNTKAAELFEKAKNLYGADWNRLCDTSFLRSKGELLYWRVALLKDEKEMLALLREAESVFLQIMQIEPLPQDCEMLSHIYENIASLIWEGNEVRKHSEEERKLIEAALHEAIGYARRYQKSEKTICASSRLCKVLSRSSTLFRDLDNDVAAVCCETEMEAVKALLDDTTDDPIVLRILRDVEIKLGVAPAESEEEAQETAALRHLEKAIALSLRLPDPSAEDLVELGGIYHNLGSRTYARQAYQQGDEYCERSKEILKQVVLTKPDGVQSLKEKQNRVNALVLLWETCVCQAEAQVKQAEDTQEKVGHLHAAEEYLKEGAEWLHRIPKAARRKTDEKELMKVYRNLGALYGAKTKEIHAAYRCRNKALEYCATYLKKENDREIRLCQAEILVELQSIAAAMEAKGYANLPKSAKTCRTEAERVLTNLLKQGREHKVLVLCALNRFEKAVAQKNPEQKRQLLREAQGFVMEAQTQESTPVVDQLLRDIIQQQSKLR